MSEWRLVACAIGAALLALPLFQGCGSVLPPDKGAAVQAGLDAGKAACLVLQSDPAIPREPGVDAYCQVVLGGCAAP